MDDTARGARIKAAREARAMTQAHLAGAAGISVRTMMRLEAGQSPSPETLRSIASVLEVDVATLVTSHEANEPPQAGQVAPPSPDSPLEPAETQSRPGRRKTNMATVALLACTSVMTFCLGHRLAWASVFASGAEGLPPFQVLVDRVSAHNLSLALRDATASLAAGKPSSGSWASEPDTSRISYWRACSPLGLKDYLRHGPGISQVWDIDGSCTSRKIGIDVRKSGPDGMDLTVGPLGPEALADLVAMLPRSPGVDAKAAIGMDANAAPRSLAWFDPYSLPWRNVPRATGNGYLHLVLTPASQTR